MTKRSKPKAKEPAKKAAKVKAPKPEKKANGAPSIYTQDLADEFCHQISMGKSLRTICSMEGMPDGKTIFNWFRTKEGFVQQYARAKAESAEAMAEEILDIADDGRNDWMEKVDKDGNCIGWMLNGEHVKRSRLRIDTRRWLASKLKPKKYGEHLDVTNNTTLTYIRPEPGMSAEDAALAYRQLLQSVGIAPPEPSKPHGETSH